MKKNGFQVIWSVLVLISLMASTGCQSRKEKQMDEQKQEEAYEGQENSHRPICAMDFFDSENSVIAIYCTPKDIAQCQPFAIRKTPNGWMACYGEPIENVPLKVLPPPEDKEGNTISFEEVVEEGKAYRTYSFACNHGNRFCDGIYEDANGKSYFSAMIVKESDIIINKKNIKTAIETINADESCGFPSRRLLNLAYLIHENPGTLNYSFPESGNLQVATSQDGMLRTYLTRDYTGGIGAGSSYDFGFLQFRSSNDVLVLDDLTSILLSQLKDFREANFPYFYDLKVHQITCQGEDCYLLETNFSDERPMFFKNSNEYFKTGGCAIYAYRIQDGKLFPAMIISGKSCIEVVVSQDSEEPHFWFDASTGALGVPKVNPTDHTLTGEYDMVKL